MNTVRLGNLSTLTKLAVVQHQEYNYNPPPSTPDPYPAPTRAFSASLPSQT